MVRNLVSYAKKDDSKGILNSYGCASRLKFKSNEEREQNSMIKNHLIAIFVATLLTCTSAAAQDHLLATHPFHLCNVIVVTTSDQTEMIRQKLKA